MTMFESGRSSDDKPNLAWEQAMQLGAKRKGEFIKFGGRYYKEDPNTVLHSDEETYYGYKEVSEEEYRAKRAKARMDLARAASRLARNLFTGGPSSKSSGEMVQ